MPSPVPRRHRRRRAGWLRGGAGGRAARRRGHPGRLRRGRRVGGAHRLRAQQDPDRHRRADDRRRGRRRARRRAHRPPGRRGRPRSASTWPGSTPASSSSPATRATTSPRGWRRRACEVVARPRPARRARHRGGRHRRRRGAARAPTPSCSPPAPRPRTLPEAQPDGERILTWEQVYDLTELPEPPDRGRLRRHGRGVRQRLPRPRRPRSPWSRAATGCCPARTPTPRPCSRRCCIRRGMHVLARSRMASVTPRRRHRDGHPHRRPHRRGVPLHPGRGLGAAAPRGSVSRPPASTSTTRGFVDRRPGLADHAPAGCTPPATAPGC